MSAVPELDYKNQPDNHDLDHIPGTYGTPIIGETFPWIKDV